MSDKKWKRVGDYPPPVGERILVRHIMSGGVVSEAYIFLGSKDGPPLSKLAQWCELDFPTEVADPPIDEQLEAEAKALRDAWKVGGSVYIEWEHIADYAKTSWRDVALQARELHANPWRPMSELEDRHERRVMVKRENGTVMVMKNTSRASDSVYRRKFWKEID